jgi:lipoprotein-releasing system ATP-binding protein
MAQNVFEIRNLTCGYNLDTPNQKEVLFIEHLDIPRGKVIFLLGRSGSGKSTMLETLGLMNHTIVKGSQLSFFPKENSSQSVDFSQLWKNRQKRDIANLRKEHFSFIFQNTNLMPNFTALENICLTEMIQGASMSESAVRAKEKLAAMNLGKVTDENLTYELSGGERQRIAFIRAIIPSFTVLFGDEPTGNLDEDNASNLMQLLVNEVKPKNKSTIIVSHDIDLALNYGDLIICIRKKDKMGHIDQSSLIAKGENNWNKPFIKSIIK